jgi:hypothetical protein
MRLGLRGQVRRVWAPRGVKVRQALELTYVWRYLAVAVDGVHGRLWWQWMTNMKQESVAAVVHAWQDEEIGALVWDGAASHRARVVRDIGVAVITQPAASPELNPAERVFEELRRAVEGRVYGTIAAKMAAVEAVLQRLAITPQAIRRLAGWDWICDTLDDRAPVFPALS